MKTLTLYLALSVAICAASLNTASAAPKNDAPTGPTIELPKFEVKELPVVPDMEAGWRYAEIPGFEILAQCNDKATQDFAQAIALNQQILEIVFPVLNRVRAPKVAILLIRTESLWKQISGSAYNDCKVFLSDASGQIRTLAIYEPQLGRLGLTIKTIRHESQSGEVRDERFAAQNVPMALYTQIRLQQLKPRLPAWVEIGLIRLMYEIYPDRKEFTFASGTSLVAEGHIPPMRELLTTPNGAITLNDIVTSTDDTSEETIRKQSLTGHAFAFTLWGLYGEGKIWRKGFLQFVVDTAKQDADYEAAAQHAFGMSLKDINFRIKGWENNTRHEQLDYTAKKGEELKTSPITIRDATDAEIGRIKGEAYRFASLLPEAKMATYAPYIRGERDPQLLASLGLVELALSKAKDGHAKPERARKLLEAAYAAKTVNAEACLTLAQLRFETLRHDQAMAKGPNAKLTAQQASSIVDAIFAARLLPPSNPGVYDLFADVIDYSAITPDRAQLSMLTEGARLFPSAERIVRYAKIYNWKGFPDIAKNLLQSGTTLGSLTAADKAKLNSALKEL
jgi:hypothetical protein